MQGFKTPTPKFSDAEEKREQKLSVNLPYFNKSYPWQRTKLAI